MSETTVGQVLRYVENELLLLLVEVEKSLVRSNVCNEDQARLVPFLRCCRGE